ncbi:putative hydrolase [Salinivibrio phage CW02]|uniref:Putative hydrolase n=1 Tax=Salinivibrio phage CW02 TaxID=1161935 RepID=H9D1J1_9CAUD|nr:endolysin [Salinivibrio phage CW02]AFE86233.1 putative hydrolase [Salinivibrio phage CW02]
MWLALNVHHEARGEPKHCQVMAVEVVLRRKESEYYPNTVQSVVLEPYQFSWTLTEDIDFSVITKHDRAVAFEAFIRYQTGQTYTTTELHYARYDVDNYWTRQMTPTVRCGAHVFYDNGGRR